MITFQDKRLILNSNPLFHKTKAFSLVEMLMALLVASLLMAALAPVITKRYSDSINVAGATGGGRAPAGMKCWNWEAKDLNSNNQRIIADFKLDEVWYANFILASGGAGGAGATISSEENDSIDSTNSTLTTTGLKITKDMADFEITSLIGGGGGAGGGSGVFSSNTCSGSPSETKCECMGQKYDPISKVCVSSNIGSNTRANAISACNTVTPSGKWTLPNTTQLANWNTNAFYNNLGITSGETAWAQNTATGSCASSSPVTRYKCTCNGSSRSGYSSSSSCCSGCSYGSSSPVTRYSCYCNGSYRSGYSSSSSCCSGCSYGSSAGWGSCSYKGYDKRDISFCYGPTSCPSGWTSASVDCSAGSAGGIAGCQRCGRYTWDSGNTCSSTVTSSTSGGNTCASTASSYSSSVCNSYYTNYYYYQLSGNSWTSSYSTSAAGNRSTYCVYNDTQDVVGESFYSLSGGGGAGSPAIMNNNFNSNISSIFNQKIKENPGGYIVLEKGKGGQGGSGSANKNQKASNGEDGEPSCIAILDSSRKLKFRLCTKGGKGGQGSDATKSDSSTSGYGTGGSETPTSNSCFIIDYSDTTNPDGNKTTFDCSDKGKQGGPGGASTNNPTTGGLGGASVLNNITVSNNGKDGITASSSNYGAGGGGGTAVKTGFGPSAVLSFGAGGNGSDGYIKLTFKHKYDGAGGGGGEAGTIAVVNNVLVGKSATCTFSIGQGGSGGGIGADGMDGGNTSVQCSNESTVYEVYGGHKGLKGTSALTSGETSTGGKGGTSPDNFNPYSESIQKLLAKNDASVFKGLQGTDGGHNDKNNTSYTNYIQGEKSSGGRGGTSGKGKKGTCGALQNDVVCSSSNDDIPTITNLNAKSYSYKDIVEPTAQSISQPTPSYGESSSGGGGGAWYQGVGSGTGGDGLGGYACVFWQGAE